MYDRIIRYFQVELGVKYIRDYPPMIIHSVPTPDLVFSEADRNATVKALSDSVKLLERDGADFIVITCLSLHSFHAKLQRLTKIPIIDFSKIIANHITISGFTNIGILGTNTTIQNRVVTQFLSKKIQISLPNEKNRIVLGKIILRIIAGRSAKKDKALLIEICTELINKGAEAVLLACTELPLIVSQKDCAFPIIDCNSFFAEKTAEYAIIKDH
ncbi:hypothetical protein COZ14_00845 [Candidatus Dojkabacteria bacterium CG_4_10_14_3_um_filter_Dojkabacteria_WS6_41_9]|nr:MAG: hypothetical protein COZ14_00845 [Candidatus Dojkabacteria bacterium CG_4_10_14_3_um_filter_Dojkabacteria_WS6_41_9]